MQKHLQLMKGHFTLVGFLHMCKGKDQPPTKPKHSACRCNSFWHFMLKIDLTLPNDIIAIINNVLF